MNKIILHHSEKKEFGYVGVQDFSDLTGQEGIALTPLRPAGTIVVQGRKLDAVTEGGFIAKDSRVKIIQVEAMRIVVRPVEE